MNNSNNDSIKNEANEENNDNENFITLEKFEKFGVTVDIGSLTAINNESVLGRGERKTDLDLVSGKLGLGLDCNIKLEEVVFEEFDDCNSEENDDSESFESLDDGSVVPKSLNEEIEETEEDDEKLSLSEEDWDTYETALIGNRESTENQRSKKHNTLCPSFEKGELGFGEMIGLSRKLTLEEVLEILGKQDSNHNIRKLPFHRLIHEIANELSLPDLVYRFSSSALEALQLASENLLINMFLLVDSDSCDLKSFQMALERQKKKIEYPPYCYGIDSNGMKRTWDLMVDDNERSLSAIRTNEMNSDFVLMKKYYSRVPNEDLHWIEDEVV